MANITDNKEANMPDFIYAFITGRVVWLYVKSDNKPSSIKFLSGRKLKEIKPL